MRHFVTKFTMFCPISLCSFCILVIKGAPCSVSFWTQHFIFGRISHSLRSFTWSKPYDSDSVFYQVGEKLHNGGYIGLFSGQICFPLQPQEISQEAKIGHVVSTDPVAVKETDSVVFKKLATTFPLFCVLIGWPDSNLLLGVGSQWMDLLGSRAKYPQVQNTAKVKAKVEQRQAAAVVPKLLSASQFWHIVQWVQWGQEACTNVTQLGCSLWSPGHFPKCFPWIIQGAVISICEKLKGRKWNIEED